MSRRRVIELPNVKHSAPIPAAVLVDNVLASSALFGADPYTGSLPDRIEDEVAFLFDNIRAVLDAAGATTDDLLRMDVLLREGADRAIINQHWLAMFPEEADRPARHITVVANLPARAQVQLIAVLAKTSEERPGHDH